MLYKALYRTYRPQTFDEVAGQQHIVKTLKNALATGKIAHAYLFAGPRGTGKTTMAKLFAKALNCEEGVGHQCNTCKNCQAIMDGSHPDVLELDAASNNGVDEIREIIDKVKYGTILGKYKVYIIDEVHMLTPGAFNALLKTLEEPPEHVVFILATTEPHKILPTILSRCQRYDFTKVPDNDLKERIKVILEKENIEYNEEAVNLIISLSDGGARDALSNLDKVLAYSGNKLNVEDILNIYSLESKAEKIELIKSVVKNDVSDVLDRINHYVTKGSDISRLTNDLLVILKDLLIYQSSRNPEYLESLSREEASELNMLISHENIVKMIDELMNAIKDYKNVSSINPLFEITLLKLASFDYGNSSLPKMNKPLIKQPMEEGKIEEPEPVKEEKPAPKIQEPEPIKEVSPLINVDIDENYIYLKGSDKEESFEIDDDTIINIMVTSKKELKGELLNGWVNTKKYVAHPQLDKYASLLVDGHPLVVSSNMVIVEYNFPKIIEKVNSKKNQAGMQTLLNEIFHKKIFVYGLSRSESVRLQRKYMDLLALSKLPKAADINLEFQEGK